MGAETNQHSRPTGPVYTWRVRLSARDRLPPRLVEHLGEYHVMAEPGGTTLLTGEVPDLSATYGLVMTLRDCAVQPLSLHIDRYGDDEGGKR